MGFRRLGLKPSYSRPQVSDDNAYAEALVRTAKYRPGFPVRAFADFAQARQWAAAFVNWYNVDHRHSGIRYVSECRGRDPFGLERTIGSMLSSHLQTELSGLLAHAPGSRLRKLARSRGEP